MPTVTHRLFDTVWSKLAGLWLEVTDKSEGRCLSTDDSVWLIEESKWDLKKPAAAVLLTHSFYPEPEVRKQNRTWPKAQFLPYRGSSNRIGELKDSLRTEVVVWCWRNLSTLRAAQNKYDTLFFTSKIRFIFCTNYIFLQQQEFALKKWTMESAFIKFCPFTALSFILCKTNQAWKRWIHTSDCWIKSSTSQ